jgi:glycosyltransferase involved in cell wall biosynthesis
MKIATGPLVGEYGGTTQHIINIIKYSKYELTPITPSPFSMYYNTYRLKNVAPLLLTKYRVERADIYGILLSKRLAQLDIVHLHGHPYWPEIYQKPKNTHAKYIHTVHQIYSKEDCRSEKEWNTKQWLNKLMFKSCRTSDIVISVAKWQQELLLKESIESIHIPNGVNVGLCESANPDRFREKYKIYDDFYLFGGNISKYKRPELFVKLARKMPDRLFVMIGGITRDNLIKHLNINIPENIIGLGKLPYADVIDAFSACRVLVLTSRKEIFGIVLLEAMACKKPVVAADNAGPMEIVTDGVDGLLFEPDDVNDLYEKSSGAWEDQEVGKKGYEKVKEQFDWKKVIKEIDAVYGGLVQ